MRAKLPKNPEDGSFHLRELNGRARAEEPPKHNGSKRNGPGRLRRTDGNEDPLGQGLHKLARIEPDIAQLTASTASAAAWGERN